MVLFFIAAMRVRALICIKKKKIEISSQLIKGKCRLIKR